MRPGSDLVRTAGQGLPRGVPLAASALLLSACATMVGPTVPVQPSPGKSPLAFRGDHAACMASATRQVQPVADRRADSMAAIQGMFNAAYGDCMAAHGNVVLAAAPAAAARVGTGAGSLSDPDSLAARRSLGAVIDGFRRDCDGERIAVTVTEAALSPAVEARMVELTTPGGGNCFGQPGSNAYLVAKAGGGWRRLLSAEPGSITALNTRRDGYADLELNSLGTCTYTYRWTGSRYARGGSRDCGTAAPPTLGTLSRAVRGR
jgi:hypothetical protein